MKHVLVTSGVSVLMAATMTLIYKWFYGKEKKRIVVEEEEVVMKTTTAATSTVKSVPLRILYGTQTGTAKSFAESLQRSLFALNVSGYHFDTSVVNIKEYDQDNLEHETIVIYILSTWSGGLPPADARLFCNWISDMATDFRVSKSWLGKSKHAVFGLGNAEYDEEYCTAAELLDKNLNELGSKALCQLGKGDDNVDQAKQFNQWMDQLIASLCESTSAKTKVPLKEYRRQKKGKAPETELTQEDMMNNELLMEMDSDSDDDGEEAVEEPQKEPVVDVEELGQVMKESQESQASREMITPLQRKALTKEGYKLIGTHSAVKLCRWTKHQLRGRGGCYKHTFYGITSYQCMETTPSLACANKCVFCWRHHKNPVGREWRWKTDEPEMLVNGSIEKHQRMIKELRGLPGLQLDRWQEAFTVRHCALSLVGEPIMYPHINQFVKLLHEREISSFLVTNAQFPDKIAELDPVTQLYVSVDAATKESLRAIDRPLFKDFWARFLSCLKQLKEKGQRTVYRMTLVKSYNMDEINGYSELIELGQPDLIEIKGVTYCGKSDGSDLTMKNVPWHEEVRAFASALCDNLDGKYGLAAEHSHSNCVLLAKTTFRINNRWHTWIDYDKFHMLMKRYYNDGTPFVAMDYIAETPSWALYGAPEEGFDPIETRFRRTKNGTVSEIQYKPSDTGCG